MVATETGFAYVRSGGVTSGSASVAAEPVPVAHLAAPLPPPHHLLHALLAPLYPRVAYIALHMTAAARRELYRAFPPVHAVGHGTHVTCMFAPSPLHLHAALLTQLGTHIRLAVIAHNVSRQAQAVRVAWPADGGGRRAGGDGSAAVRAALAASPLWPRDLAERYGAVEKWGKRRWDGGSARGRARGGWARGGGAGDDARGHELVRCPAIDAHGGAGGEHTGRGLSANAHPHITLSVARTVGAKASNVLLARVAPGAGAGAGAGGSGDDDDVSSTGSDDAMLHRDTAAPGSSGATGTRRDGAAATAAPLLVVEAVLGLHVRWRGDGTVASRGQLLQALCELHAHRDWVALMGRLATATGMATASQSGVQAAWLALLAACA